MIAMRKQLGIVLLATLVLACGALVRGGPVTDERYSKLSESLKESLGDLRSMDRQVLQQVAAGLSADELRSLTRQILDAGSLAVGARDAEAIRKAEAAYTRAFQAAGDDKVARRRAEDALRTGVHQFVHKWLTDRGLQHVASMRSEVVAPVLVENQLEADGGQEETSLTVGKGDQARRFDVLPLWPNGAMPSLCPKEGITGRLVYVRKGDLRDIEGLDLEGAIAVMDFEGARNFEQLHYFGARAIIVVEDDRVTRDRAEGLFCNTPIPSPRFFLQREQGEQLVKRCTRIDHRNGVRQPTDGETATLRGGHVWERRPVESMFFYLPPNDATTPDGAALLAYTVKDRDLLNRIRSEMGASLDQLTEDNEIVRQLVTSENPKPLVPGDKLVCSALDKTYVIEKNDLITRIANEFGVDPKAIISANDPAVIGDGVGIQAGAELIVPAVPGQTIFLMAPIDSVSVVPDAPHGATSAANLAMLLKTVEHLAKDTTVRRKGVMVALLDGEHLGGRGSRLFAEYVMLAQDQLGGTEETPDFPYFGIVFGILLGGGIGAFVGAMLAMGDPDKPRPLKQRTLPATITGGGCAIVGCVIALMPYVRGEVTAGVLSPETRLAYYDQCAQWMENPEANPLTRNAATWLGEEWMIRRADKVRTDAAEKSAMFGKQQGELIEQGRSTGGDAYRALQRKINSADRLLDAFVEIKDRTLYSRSLNWQERVNSFWRELQEIEQRGYLAKLPEDETRQSFDEAVFKELEAEYRRRLSPARLRTRFNRERAEERRQQRYDHGNLLAVKQILGTIHPQAKPDTHGVQLGQGAFGWQFALSDGSSSFGIPGSNHFRGEGYANGKLAGSYKERLKEISAYAANTAGWTEDWVFVNPDEDGVEFPVVEAVTPANYSKFWNVGKVAYLPFATHNEQHFRLDTPWDTVDRTNFGNLATQGKHIAAFIGLGVESPLNSQPPESIDPPDCGRLVGKVVRFNARSGIDAQEEVVDVLVYYPAIRNKVQQNEADNSSTFRGYRRGVIVMSQLNGEYRLPVETTKFNKTDKSTPHVYGYKLDRDLGLFYMVVDQGQIGTQKKSPRFQLVPGKDEQKELIMTEVYPWVFFPGPDPMDYAVIGDTRQKQDVRVMDAVLNGEPTHYAQDNPAKEYKESELKANILYMEQGRRARVIVQKNEDYKLLLIGEVISEEEAQRRTREAREEDPDAPRVKAWEKGRGHLIGPKGTRGEPGYDPNVYLVNTELQVAREMRALNRFRRDQFEARNLRDPAINVAIDRAGEKLAAADEAVEAREWRESIGKAREAWGMLVKIQPRILGLGREAVFSAVILMALMVPCAAFLERLLIGSKGIIARLVGTTIIFIVAMVFLKLTHPALKIAVSPFIVMIAFIMILMAVIVLAICYQRFEVLVRRARASAGEVESEEISLLASLGTALSLGVSNLKKRPSRTFLTAMTVSVLTFSIITFVSVKGRDDLHEQAVPLATQVILPDGPVEHDPQQIQAPAYTGVLFRDFQWHSLDRNFVSAIRSEFSANHEVTVRGFYIQREGGNNADREGTNEEPVRRLPDRHVVKEGETLADVAKKWFVDPKALLGPNGLEKVDAPLTPGATLRIPRTKSRMTVKAVMGFEPNETEFSGIHRAVSNHEWFKGEVRGDDPRPEDRLKVILPDVAAKRLNIRLVDLYRMNPDAPGQTLEQQVDAGDALLRPDDELPLVNFKNTNWRVIGILDTSRADRYRDINGQSLAIVDHIRSAFTTGTAGDVANEGASYHLSWQELVMIPMAGGDRVDMKERSVAIKLDTDQMTDEQIEQFRQDLALRINRTMFGSFGAGQYNMITSQSEQSVGGLAKIIVPVLLCVLIVLNTMMGAVDERKGEVGMLGAIGLSPSQISFLLLSESTVFSVLGIIFGTLTGLLFAWMIPAANRWFDTDLLMGMSFNFTSVMSMLLAMATGVVVLMATLIPAKRAAALAAPSGMEKWELPEPNDRGGIQFQLPFTLTRGNAVGMMSFFRQYLLNHTDATSLDYNCRNINLSRREGEEEALVIACNMWLAPYDLDVSQGLEMKVVPTENEGVFAVVITLDRHSGTEEAWLRTNYGFLNLVRHQFLIWRNLDNKTRESHIERGAELFREVGR